MSEIRERKNLRGSRREKKERNIEQQAVDMGTIPSIPSLFPNDRETQNFESQVDISMNAIEEIIPSFSQSSQSSLSTVVETLRHALKYDLTLRVGVDKPDFSIDVNEAVLNELKNHVVKQNEILKKLNLFAESIDQQRLGRFSVSVCQPIDLSCSDNSVDNSDIKISDIVEYTTQYMITSNRLQDLVANLNTKLEKAVNVRSDTTVYEDLLNATEDLVD
ncbi:hypothetical protein EIN_359250 [Entamoeba invadens IP1]|uniref:Uncharacterized protein n=1 Tax=Entamoeba invadens IP1 TaxID=370355 RepID=A0A0A1U7N0_ENTIV|nr:hypothetical protein EIN_359250 [Entamoeba invadens IP1]ELP90842.1 hypothetical protein EIN_359250 [Entamoeba invadens IP1]|eukprot:XP_004257613.1 hypothetical protein EIN_359250 [Entamoeba invadens IP1]